MTIDTSRARDHGRSPGPHLWRTAGKADTDGPTERRGELKNERPALTWVLTSPGDAQKNSSITSLVDALSRRARNRSQPRVGGALNRVRPTSAPLDTPSTSRRSRPARGDRRTASVPLRPLRPGLPKGRATPPSWRNIRRASLRRSRRLVALWPSVPRSPRRTTEQSPGDGVTAGGCLAYAPVDRPPQTGHLHNGRPPIPQVSDPLRSR
jgi:hypothetical protein